MASASSAGSSFINRRMPMFSRAFCDPSRRACAQRRSDRSGSLPVISSAEAREAAASGSPAATRGSSAAMAAEGSVWSSAKASSRGFCAGESACTGDPASQIVPTASRVAYPVFSIIRFSDFQLGRKSEPVASRPYFSVALSRLSSVRGMTSTLGYFARRPSMNLEASPTMTRLARSVGRCRAKAFSTCSAVTARTRPA